MNFISTPAELYSPENMRVMQTVAVYMDARGVPPVVHLTQYDRTIPVVAVNIWYNGQPYAIPAGAAVNVRMSKPDGKHVYDPALGVSSDRLTAYIAITAQMTAAAGPGKAILEIVLDGGVAGTAPMAISIDRNPVPTDAYESADEYKTLYDLIQDAAASAEAAATSERLAGESASSAKSSAEAAAGSATAAEASRQAATETLGQVQQAETDALANIEDKRQAAVAEMEEIRDTTEGYKDEAAQSATDAAASAAAAKDSEDAAAASQAAAKASEGVAEDRSNVSKSWAVGEGMGDKRPDEATNNAKAYAEKAQASAESAAGSVKVIEDNAEAIQTVEDNLEGILGAPDAALRAEAAADSAEFDADRASEAADRAQSIAQGAKGYYETPEALRGALPEGTRGEWAIVGSTDTIWVWDEDTSAWKDTHQATDLSNYYTKDEADTENNKLLAQVTQETDVKLDGKVSKSGDTMSGKLTNESGFVGPLTGNASSASKLTPGANINGVLYTGASPITVYDSTKMPLNSWQGAVDFNTLLRSGFYQVQGVHTNAPTAGDGHYHVMVMWHTDSWVRQIAFDVRNNVEWARGRLNGVWSSWQKISHDGVGVAASCTGNAATANSAGYATSAGSATRVSQALTFTGAVNTSYDGSAARTVNIPTGMHITLLWSQPNIGNTNIGAASFSVPGINAYMWILLVTLNNSNAFQTHIEYLPADVTLFNVSGVGNDAYNGVQTSRSFTVTKSTNTVSCDVCRGFVGGSNPPFLTMNAYAKPVYIFGLG